MSEWHGANPDLTRPVIVVHLATEDVVPMLLCRPTLYRVVSAEVFRGTPRVQCPLCMKIAEGLVDGLGPEPPPPDQSWIRMTSIRDDQPPSPVAPAINASIVDAPSVADALLVAETTLRGQAARIRSWYREYPA